MPAFNSTSCRFARTWLVGCLAGLMGLGACSEDGKPAILLDAAPSGSIVDAAAPSQPDAATSWPSDGSLGANDASVPGNGDAAEPRPVDASGPEAATSDAGDAGVSDGAAVDGAAVDATAPAAARPLSTSLMLPNTKQSPGAEPIFNVYQPTDIAGAIAASGRPLPVIVWANGGCLRSIESWEPLLKRWAAAGFVVLGLSVKPGAGLLDALASTSQVEHGKMIDWALEQAKKPGSPYAGNIDTNMIVAAGNSCGGVTAMELASKDSRVRAVFVLSGSSAVGGANTAVISAIKVPVGFVVGNAQQDIAAPNALMDYQMLTVPTMIVNRSMGDHLTVSTDTKILPEVAEIALNWLDLALYGNVQAAAALKAPTVCAGCTPGTWTLQSKQLETLAK